MTRNVLIVFFSVALTLGSGLIFTRIRHVAGMGMDLEPMATKLVDLPGELNNGAWTRIEDHELDEQSFKMLECKGYHYASYANSEGAVAQAIVLLGPAGPIAVHTPEICFSSRAYKISKARRPMKVKLDRHESSELGKVIFESKSIDGHLLNVAYGWTTDGTWLCPDSSRREFAGSPYLYKVQIVLPVPADATDEEQAAIDEFAHDFLMMLNEQLFD